MPVKLCVTKDVWAAPGCVIFAFLMTPLLYPGACGAFETFIPDAKINGLYLVFAASYLFAAAMSMIDLTRREMAFSSVVCAGFGGLCAYGLRHTWTSLPSLEFRLWSVATGLYVIAVVLTVTHLMRPWRGTVQPTAHPT
ncbi:MAG: hypothetical protein H6811_05740 [Phycisphaeraceae bacterium]|nr:hypothetical protein [Phycisphaeraceae bacterium]